MLLQQIQARACALGIKGRVEKRGNDYWLLPLQGQLWWFFGDHPYFLGNTQLQIVTTLVYLGELFEDQYYAQIGQERYGLSCTYGDDPERAYWEERAEWESWWKKNINPSIRWW